MTNILSQLHLYNMILVLATSTITGIWGLILYFRSKRKTIERIAQSWKIALIVTAIVGLLQGLLGVGLVLMGLKPGGGTGLYYLHYVYGAIVVFSIPVAYTYIGKDKRRAILILSIAALVIAAAGARGMMTGLGIGG
jgi:heme A synthase